MQVINVENFIGSGRLEGGKESYSHSYPHYPQDVDNFNVDNSRQYRTYVLFTYHKSTKSRRNIEKSLDNSIVKRYKICKSVI